MLDPAFAATAATEFDQVPARGPYTLAMANSALFLPLPNMTIAFIDTVERIRSMTKDDSATLYLPDDYHADPNLLAGYKRQLSVLADLLGNPRVPSLEAPFASGTSIRAIRLHPLSRGTVRLNITNHLEQPVLDYRIGSNPVDFDLDLAHVKYLRAMLDTQALKEFNATLIAPDPSIQSDEALLEYIKESMTLSFMHPCCTAAMMPRELGGVVDTALKVHGAAGLRIVDMSILPLLPSAHLSATAYAVGEKVS